MNQFDSHVGYVAVSKRLFEHACTSHLQDATTVKLAIKYFISSSSVNRKLL